MVISVAELEAIELWETSLKRKFPIASFLLWQHTSVAVISVAELEAIELWETYGNCLLLTGGFDNYHSSSATVNSSMAAIEITTLRLKITITFL